MKKIVLSLLACTGIFYTANAQAPRVYDTATAASTVINYPTSKEALVTSGTEELLQLSVTLSMQPVNRKMRSTDRRARKKARTALPEMKTQPANTLQAYVVKGTH